MGYFKYTGLPFEISIAPGIYQAYMEKLLKDIEGVAVLIDTIALVRLQWANSHGKSRKSINKIAEQQFTNQERELIL